MYAMTPERVFIKWQPPANLNGPKDSVGYAIEYKTDTQVRSIHLVKNNTTGFRVALTNWYEYDLVGLVPKHLYNITVKACAANKTMCTSAASMPVRTFDAPRDLEVVERTAHSITIKYTAPTDNSVSRHTLHVAEVTGEDISDWMWEVRGIIMETLSSQQYTDRVDDLKPNTKYAFTIKAVYSRMQIYEWPAKPFIYSTDVYKPEQPLPPTWLHSDTGNTFEINWEQPEDNGAAVIYYVLEYRDVEKSKWSMVYNGSNDHWLVETSTLEKGQTYIFRVAAVNSQGWSPFSDNSSTLPAALVLSAIAKQNAGGFQMTTATIVGLVIGGIVFAIVLVFLVICFAMRRKFDKKRTNQLMIRGPDTELATLRELPHTAFQQSNSLYGISIQCTDEEIAKLPHFSRTQLALTMFLGSGAFGEVFEGLAKNILADNSGQTKCAVKTLRKSASDQEKEEFLKEALLMRNFQHEHILPLLGVCLDNDPQFIIMELMEGGDLLSFLRSCRGTQTSPAKLFLPDLVKIVVHVARGCKYLEDMRFVHRDLAARNCLVSTKNPKTMVVKIGDFGLARDIYKNDYYRKEGEGLLPVRWMSPESLVDGLFTAQSDIWAFGVLMWEVVTLGQQPYPARTNIEVLHFVRARGKLERPEKCADEMYNLMRKCWSFSASDRPSFTSLLEELEMFEEKCSQMSLEEITLLSPSSNVCNGSPVSELEKHKVDEDDDEEDDDCNEKDETKGLVTLKTRTFTGGGSVRLTQSEKQRRLSDLLGSETEKLCVDLTHIGRKRTHSLDSESKQSNYDISFPAAGNYDHNAYLEPRGAEGGRYLDLLNYAPELKSLKDPYGKPLSKLGSAFTAVHMTRKGYHPSNVSYTLISPNEEQEDACNSSDRIQNSRYVDTRKHNSRKPYGLVSLQESPIRCQSSDNRRSNSSDISKKSPERKYSDQDLYSSPDYYRHRDDKPYSAQSNYTSVECNNNRHSFTPQRLGSGSSSGRSRHGSGNHSYSKAGPTFFPANEGANINGKLPNRDNWASNSDDVFLENSELPSGYDSMNHRGQGLNISRSRAQVHPENNGFDIAQVTLV